MRKAVFITGADKGLGLSLVKRFLQGGFHVFTGIYSSGENLKRVAEEFPGMLTQIEIDVSDLASVQCAARMVAEQISGLDILINNAAIHIEKPVKPLEELDFANLFLQKTMNVNAFGPLYVTQQFLPLLNRAERKLIVNISSEAGSIADCRRPSEYAYCMSKSALNMASKILQNSLQPRGFKVLAIHPGWMRTDMGGMEADFDPDEVAEDIFQLLMKTWQPDDPIFMDRLGNPLPW